MVSENLVELAFLLRFPQFNLPPGPPDVDEMSAVFGQQLVHDVRPQSLGPLGDICGQKVMKTFPSDVGEGEGEF